MTYEEILKQYEDPSYFGNISDPGVNEQRARWFLGYFKMPEGSLVLELGAGKFTLTTAWRRLGMQAWGVDVSEFGCTYEPDAAVRALCQVLPFRDKSFDLVTAFDVYEHLPPGEVPKAVAELARVVRRYAALNIPIEAPDPNDHHHLSKMSRPEWDAFFAEDFVQEYPQESVAGFNNNGSVFVLRPRP